VDSFTAVLHLKQRRTAKFQMNMIRLHRNTFHKRS